MDYRLWSDKYNRDILPTDLCNNAIDFNCFLLTNDDNAITVYYSLSVSQDLSTSGNRVHRVLVMYTVHQRRRDNSPERRGSCVPAISAIVQTTYRFSFVTPLGAGRMKYVLDFLYNLTVDSSL